MLPASAAAAFLPFALVIGIWVSWNDMARMKIPNKAVLALLAVWALVGPLVLPWQIWLWGWGFGAVGLVLGFVANLGLGLGAGDAKFAAAMAPFFVLADLRLALFLIMSCMIGALVTHRLLGRIGFIRAATPGWQSWTSGRYFPFGLALSGILIFYLALELRA
jgi:prepilin peptidase CpaA